MFLKDKIDKVIGEDSFGRTHMPFVFYDEYQTYNILFDIRFGKEWKLYWFNEKTNEVKKVKTPEKNTMCSECNSMLYIKDNLYHLTYTFNDMIKHHRCLMHATGKDLNNLNWEKPLNYEIGLINEKYICTGHISYNMEGRTYSFLQQ